MMSVEEYALDINRDISVVLKKCKELGIDAKENDDLLDDEGITMLDNAFANEPEEEVIEDEIEDEFGENVEVVVQNKKVNATEKKILFATLSPSNGATRKIITASKTLIIKFFILPYLLSCLRHLLQRIMT